MFVQPETVGDKLLRLVVVVIMIVVIVLLAQWISSPPSAGAFSGGQVLGWL